VSESEDLDREMRLDTEDIDLLGTVDDDDLSD